MKKFISISAHILAFSIISTERKVIPADGDKLESAENVTKEVEVVMGKGDMKDLPEDNDHVKSLILKGHLRAATAEEIAAEATNIGTGATAQTQNTVTSPGTDEQGSSTTTDNGTAKVKSK